MFRLIALWLSSLNLAIIPRINVAVVELIAVPSKAVIAYSLL